MAPPAADLAFSGRRHRSLTFLFHASIELRVSSIVKYTALSLFIDRFLPRLDSISSEAECRSWLLTPLTESNLQLFTLVSLWISSKIHDRLPFSVKSLKSLGDEVVKDQHFITRDYVEAELIFLKVLRFEIGVLDIAFVFVEELYILFREVAKAGDFINFDTCIDILDLLYEVEDVSIFRCAKYLAASVLVASYFISVPKLFPILPWVKLATSCGEEDIAAMVRIILEFILKPIKASS